MKNKKFYLFLASMVCLSLMPQVVSAKNSMDIADYKVLSNQVEKIKKNPKIDEQVDVLFLLDTSEDMYENKKVQAFCSEINGFYKNLQDAGAKDIHSSMMSLSDGSRLSPMKEFDSKKLLKGIPQTPKKTVNSPEQNGKEAMLQGISGTKWRKGSTHVIVVITDTFIGEDGKETDFKEIAQAARSRHIQFSLQQMTSKLESDNVGYLNKLGEKLDVPTYYSNNQKTLREGLARSVTPRNQCVVKVMYVDVLGKEIAATETITGSEEEEYDTASRDISGYTVISATPNEKGKFTKDEITVKYTYRKNTEAEKFGKIIIQYIDEEGKEIHQIEERIGEVGEEYTLAEKEIVGYELVDYSGSIKGEYTEKNQEVIYKYKRKSEKGRVEVHYVNEEGKELAEPTVIEEKLRVPYVAKGIRINGYEIIKTPENEKGIIQKETQIVTFVYKKLHPDEMGVVEIYCVDGKGRELIDVTTVEGRIGVNYETKAANIKGYKLVKEPENAKGTYKKGTEVITYVYEEGSAKDELRVEIVFHDENGKAIGEPKYITGKLGEKYTVKAESINGYEMDKNQRTIEGTFGEGDGKIVCSYKKIPEGESGKVLIKYVTDTGESVQPTDEMIGRIGTEYAAKAKDITGYDLISTPNVHAGAYTKEDQIITYIYRIKEVAKEQRGNIEIHFIDESGKNIAESQQFEGVVGKDYTTTPVAIKGYQLMTTPANATGKYTKESQKIVYVYRVDSQKQTGNVEVFFVDENGTELTDKQLLTGEVGESYQVQPITIEGYDLIKADETTGTFTAESKKVTFVYRLVNKKKVIVPPNGKNILPQTGESNNSLVVLAGVFVLTTVGLILLIVKNRKINKQNEK